MPSVLNITILRGGKRNCFKQNKRYSDILDFEIRLTCLFLSATILLKQRSSDGIFFSNVK